MRAVTCRGLTTLAATLQQPSPEAPVSRAYSHLALLVAGWLCVLSVAGSVASSQTQFVAATYDYDESARNVLSAPTTAPLVGMSGGSWMLANNPREPGDSRFAFANLLAAKDVRSIDPDLVRFSQDSIKGTFKNGGTVEDLAAGLRSGAIKPGDVPAIRVVERNGELFTLDNRRLEAFRRAGVPIRYRYATPQEAAREAFKFTTRNRGQSVRVRGG